MHHNSISIYICNMLHMQVRLRNSDQSHDHPAHTLGMHTNVSGIVTCSTRQVSKKCSSCSYMQLQQGLTVQCAWVAGTAQFMVMSSLGSDVARWTNLRSHFASTASFERALTKMLKPVLELPCANSLPGFFCCRLDRACIHACQQLMSLPATLPSALCACSATR